MNSILARKLILVTQSGRKIEYTHVTMIYAKGNVLTIHGETDDVDGSRFNAKDDHKIEGLIISTIEWYKPLG